jgi:TRAP-type uncharacterized transport system fused permease subunit
VLYFASVAFYVHFHAAKSGVGLAPERPDLAVLAANAPLFVGPVAVILALLFWGYPSMYAAFWGIASLLAVSLLRRRTRPSWGQVVDGCVKGATIGAKVAVACATLGPIIALVTKTGLGLTIGYSVEAWAGGSLFLALLICMACVIVLGLEVPTVAAYLIAAMVAIPALVRLGLHPQQAHMFAFYFGAFSALTPPVGMAAIVASRLAGAGYLRTAVNSMGAAVGGFLIPLVFAYNGSLLLVPGTDPATAALSVALVLAGLALFQMGFVGYFLSRLGPAARGLALASGGGFLWCAASGQLWTLALAGAGAAAALGLGVRRRLAGQAT